MDAGKEAIRRGPDRTAIDTLAFGIIVRPLVFGLLACSSAGCLSAAPADRA